MTQPHHQVLTDAGIKMVTMPDDTQSFTEINPDGSIFCTGFNPECPGLIQINRSLNFAGTLARGEDLLIRINQTHYLHVVSLSLDSDEVGVQVSYRDQQFLHEPVRIEQVVRLEIKEKTCDQDALFMLKADDPSAALWHYPLS